MTPIHRGGRVRAAAAGVALAAGVTFGLGSGAGAGIAVKPNSNLAVGGGTYAATVSAPKGTFPAVPSGTAAPSSRTAATTIGKTTLTASAGTFSAADIGSFVDDGVGGRLPDGVSVTPITPLVAVYPRQGLATIKSVTATGNSATLSQKAVATGPGAVDLIAPTAPLLLVTQSTGSIPFIAPVPTGLCFIPAFPDAVCGYDSGNLAMGATKVVVGANPDGSLSTPFTLTEGVLDGALGTNPGPVYVRSFDPDGPGGYPVLPFAVPSTDPGATPRACAPDGQDRAIPNAGGVDYCMVTVIGLSAGVQTTRVPYQLSSFPITWAASAVGAVVGPDLVVGGSNFANNDVIVKILIVNGKAKVTGNPLVKCPALNRTITGVTADALGGLITVVPGYGTGCTVPPGSLTKVTVIGSKDVQLSQIPPNPVLGTNTAKKAVTLITMP